VNPDLHNNISKVTSITSAMDSGVDMKLKDIFTQLTNYITSMRKAGYSLCMRLLPPRNDGRQKCVMGVMNYENP